MNVNQIQAMCIGIMLGGAVGLVSMIGVSTHNTINNHKERIELLENKLADQRKINDELRSENELLAEENALRQLHEEILCSDAIQKPAAKAVTPAVYRY